MRKFLLLLLLIVVCVGSFVLWYKTALEPVKAESDQRVSVNIPQGSSLSSIASLLFEENIIRSPFAFSVYARSTGVENKLQAGTFVLRPSYSVEDVVRVLMTGKAQEERITIPEGFTVLDIDALLVEKGLIKEGEFLGCAQTCDFSEFDFLSTSAFLADRGGKVEGYLYPDTYYIAPDTFSVEPFIKRLLQTFRRRVIQELQDQIDTSEHPLNHVVIMASLIEEETHTNAERPVVSGILWNRYEASQGLGVDATVRYIINKPTAEITVEDLQVDSPYNTRKYRGLPPGPIANAGIECILAALNPVQTPYWYYLHDPSGEIHYAKTNDEHNANKRRYLN